AGDDSAIETIRAHMQEIATAFAAGDFSTPGFVHGMDEVPGTRVMAEKRGVIRYDYAPLPRGCEVRITTSDPDALQAIHEFLAFQRMDHRAMGHEMFTPPDSPPLATARPHPSRSSPCSARRPYCEPTHSASRPASDGLRTRRRSSGSRAR